MTLLVRLAACAAAVLALATAMALAWDRSDSAACAETTEAAAPRCTPR
jgi:hypothetical protein